MGNHSMGEWRLAILVCAAGLVPVSVFAAGVEITYTPSTVTACQKEPILIELAIRNALPEDVTTNLGIDRTGAFRITVARAGGAVLAAGLKRERGGVTRGAKVAIPAGEIYTQRLLLNDWFPFTEPGIYNIEIDLPSLVVTENGAAVEPVGGRDTLTVQIDPYDRGRLEKRCADLCRKVLTASNSGDALDFARAIYTVADPVAVPCLKQLVVSGIVADGNTIYALERIGTPEAIDAMIAGIADSAMSSTAVAVLTRIAAKTPDARLKERIEAAIRSR